MLTSDGDQFFASVVEDYAAVVPEWEATAPPPYVGNWDLERKVVMRYDVSGDGALSNGAVFYDMTDAPGEDALDGLKVDATGNLYVCGPGGIWVLSPEGARLGLLTLPEEPHNLAWGDDDGRTLYVTALTSTGSACGSRASARCSREERQMTDKLKVGATLPDFGLPDDTGAMHRLSVLQAALGRSLDPGAAPHGKYRAVADPRRRRKTRLAGLAIHGLAKVRNYDRHATR